MAVKKGLSEKSLEHTLRESAFLMDMLKLKIQEYHITINVAHFIATISGVILSLSLAKVASGSFATEDPLVKLGIISIVATSLVTIIITLFTVEPSLKKDRDSNTFDYGTKFTEISTKQYIDSIIKNLESKENMISSYGHELHKLDKLILHRFKMIKSAISIFVFGIFTGAMLIIISTLI